MNCCLLADLKPNAANPDDGVDSLFLNSSKELKLKYKMLQLIINY